MMRNFVVAALCAGAMGFSSALAQDATSLKAYADKAGFIKVQELTCGQMTALHPEDSSNLMSWYAGWYAGLGRKSEMHYLRVKVIERQVYTYCEANPAKRVIEAMGVILKDEKIKKGVAGK